MIITIDGSSGTGKTTVARGVAERLGFVYFDTGAMYRCFTWVVMQKGIDPANEELVVPLLGEFNFQIREGLEEKQYWVGEENVSLVIRSREVTSQVSIVAALKPVRSALLSIQRTFASGHDVVFEGRDLGTVVFPQAEYKFFLVADPMVRAERRLHEMLAKLPGNDPALDQKVLKEEMEQRDLADSTREVAPLRCPVGAFQIDTTRLSIPEVVEQIVQHVKG